jgi:paraquat-inducible protein B
MPHSTLREEARASPVWVLPLVGVMAGRPEGDLFVYSVRWDLA